MRGHTYFAKTLTFALLPGAQLRLFGVLIALRICTSVRTHGFSKLVEQNIILRLPTTWKMNRNSFLNCDTAIIIIGLTLNQLSRLGRLWFRKLLLELSGIVIIVVELLLVVILLLVVVEFLRLLLLELIALLLLVV